MNTNFTYVMKGRPVIDFGGYTLHAFQHWLFYIRMMGFQFGRCLHGTVNNYSYSKFNVLLFFLRTCRSFRPVPICKSFSFHACIMNINVSVVTVLIFPNRAFVHHHHHHRSRHTSPSLSPSSPLSSSAF